MTAGPRARLIASTIATVREHGVHASGLSELLKRSNASKNSLYQHFPGGKAELVETAARIVARLVESHVAKSADSLAAAESIPAWLDDLFGFWRSPLEESGYREGSFMMAAALDELDAGVQAVAGEAFGDWNDRMAKGLMTAGADPVMAESVANLLLTVIEGAIVQSRATKSTRAFDAARTHLAPVVQAAISARP